MVVGGINYASGINQTREDIGPDEILQSGINGQVLGDALQLANLNEDPTGSRKEFFAVPIEPIEFSRFHHSDFRVLGDDYDITRPRFVRVFHTDYSKREFDTKMVTRQARDFILKHAGSSDVPGYLPAPVFGPDAFMTKPYEHIAETLSHLPRDNIYFPVVGNRRMRNAVVNYVNERRRVTTSGGEYILPFGGWEGLAGGHLYYDLAHPDAAGGGAAPAPAGGGAAVVLD